MIFLLYQLPLEPILYIAVLWILTGLGTCAFGFHNYQKNIHNLQIISATPDINLSRMDAPSNEADALQQEIMHSLDRMRIDAETANQKTLEEMTDITRCGLTRSRHQFLLCVCSFRKSDSE